MTTSTVGSDQTKLSKQLLAPFLEDEIEWKPCRFLKTDRGGRAQMLAFVTNRAIMDRLDQVVGPFNWKNEYQKWGDRSVLCGLSLRVGSGEWITKWDGADESDMESTKGGLSNSMKRAAVQWGIGRYLYLLGATYVNADVWEKGGRLTGRATEKPRLKPEFLPGGTLPKAEAQHRHEESERGKAGGGRAEPSVTPSPAQGPAAGAVASSGEPHPEFPAPPEWCHDSIGFGKHKEHTWLYMASGASNGQRREWMRYIVKTFDEGKPKDRAVAMLAWREGMEK